MARQEGSTHHTHFSSLQSRFTPLLKESSSKYHFQNFKEVWAPTIATTPPSRTPTTLAPNLACATKTTTNISHAPLLGLSKMTRTLTNVGITASEGNHTDIVENIPGDNTTGEVPPLISIAPKMSSKGHDEH
ncbi:hypothetical protein H0H81_001841, partial [Sphagnurus paluster]